MGWDGMNVIIFGLCAERLSIEFTTDLNRQQRSIRLFIQLSPQHWTPYVCSTPMLTPELPWGVRPTVVVARCQPCGAPGQIGQQSVQPTVPTSQDLLVFY